MALTSVRVQFKGVWYDLKKNAAGKYETTIKAPSTPEDDLPLLIRALNDQGYQSNKSTTVDIKWEIVPPVVAITSPSAGGWYTDGQTPVVFTLRDEENGSGIDLSTLAFVLDGKTLGSTAKGMKCTAVENGYDCTYTPPAALADGPHKAAVSVQDRAGNPSNEAAISWKTDTAAPALTVTAPTDGLITNRPELVVTGTAGDDTSGLVSVTVNDTTIDVVEGAFSYSTVLREGQNTFQIVATDAAGLKSTVTRSVLLDTVAPVFESVHIRPDIEAEPLGNIFTVTVTMAPPNVEPSAAETVTGTVNGTPVNWTQNPAYTWTASVERSEDDCYVVVLHARDAAGNTADDAVTFPCGLGSKWTWTPLEYLNYWDLNRIEYNTRYLYNWLQENGYGAKEITTKTNWTKEDIPLRKDVDRIRGNVDDLQTCYFAIPEWREIVYNNTIDAKQMNAIEWDLHLIDEWLSKMVSQFVYSGELYAGEYP